jgi:hypothetical protein
MPLVSELTLVLSERVRTKPIARIDDDDTLDRRSISITGRIIWRVTWPVIRIRNLCAANRIIIVWRRAKVIVCVVSIGIRLLGNVLILIIVVWSRLRVCLDGTFKLRPISNRVWLLVVMVYWECNSSEWGRSVFRYLFRHSRIHG